MQTHFPAIKALDQHRREFQLLPDRCLASGHGYVFPFAVSPQRLWSLKLETPHHNSRQKKVSFNGISFLMEMAIICESGPPVVQVVAAVFGVK